MQIVSLTLILLGDDWDELERKAAKCKIPCYCAWFCDSTCYFTADQKRAEGGRKGDSDSEDDHPKKKKPAANGKNKGRR